MLPLFVMSLVLTVSAEKGLVPQGLPIEGVVVDHVRFTDRSGTHVVLVTETDVVSKEDLSAKKLFGYQFTVKNGQWMQVWNTQDFVNDCAFDLTVAYALQSLEVSDLDGDGIAETRFAYTVSCRSDVSPMPVKVLMHEGEKKFAIRGESREDASGEGDFVGGTFKADDALKKIPKFFEAAVKTFNTAAKVP